MDPLSQALAGTHLRGSLIATLDLHSPWHIDFEQSIGVPVHYIIEGEAWVSGELIAPLRLTAGNLVAFPHWTRHFLASNKVGCAQPQTITDIVCGNGQRRWIQGEWLNEALTLNLPGPGSRTRVLSMVVELERGPVDQFLMALPQMIYVAEENDDIAPWLDAILHFLANEQANPTPGFAIVQSRVAELLFMQILRAQLLLGEASLAASMRILLDPAISRTVTALRNSPAEDWTVARMARIAGLSRSGFAERFARVVEMTPFEYLRGLRLDAAAELLKQGEMVKTVVAGSGYSTAFSFAKAFQARFGTTPGSYRGIFA